MASASDQLTMDGVLRRRDGRARQAEAFIPSPAPQNHAANLMTLGDGSLACVWFGGTQEGMADISIHFAKLLPGAKAWQPAVKLIDDPTRSEQNPILFNAPNGELWLLYTSQKSGNQDTAFVRKRVSRDLGLTWSDPEVLIGDAGTFVRQPIHVMPDGALLLGTFLCRTEPGIKWVGNNDISAARRSVDGGRTWAKIEVPDSVGAVHMNIEDAGKGQLAAFYRSRWADFIYRSQSDDGGRTWSQPQPTNLPNNNSSIQAIRLQDGRLLMAYNHSSAANASERRLGLYDEIDDGDEAKMPENVVGKTAFWGAPRAPMMLATSEDGGRTWVPVVEIDTGDGYCMTNNSVEGLNRELSYPSVHQSPDGAIHVAFTYHRKAIKYVRFDNV